MGLILRYDRARPPHARNGTVHAVRFASVLLYSTVATIGASTMENTSCTGRWVVEDVGMQQVGTVFYGLAEDLRCGWCQKGWRGCRGSYRKIGFTSTRIQTHVVM